MDIIRVIKKLYANTQENTFISFRSSALLIITDSPHCIAIMTTVTQKFVSGVIAIHIGYSNDIIVHVINNNDNMPVKAQNNKSFITNPCLN